MMTQTARKAALERLEVFIGEWRLGLGHAIPPAEPGGARSVFEWALDGQLVVQHTEIPDPNAPNGLCIVAYDPSTAAYTQRAAWRLRPLRLKPAVANDVRVHDSL